MKVLISSVLWRYLQVEEVFFGQVDVELIFNVVGAIISKQKTFILTIICKQKTFILKNFSFLKLMRADVKRNFFYKPTPMGPRAELLT